MSYLEIGIVGKHVVDVKYASGDVVGDDTVDGVVAPCDEHHHNPCHRQQCKAPV